MSVVDEVAGLPGGQALAALAAQVQGSPAAVHDLANRWSKVANDSAVSTAGVGRAVSRVRQTWLGSSNDALTDLMSQFGRAGEATQQSLSIAAATLTQAGFAFEQAQKNINTICENLLIQVSQVRAVNPGAAAADAQISSLVGGATHMARAVMTTLENALNQAATALNAELPALSRGFSALRKPGDPPSHGTGMRWKGQSPRLRRGAPADDVRPVPLGVHTKELTPRLADSTRPVAVPVVQKTPVEASGAPQQVDAWILQAIQILVASGTPASQLNPQHIWHIIEHESSGNPSAVNNWDYNAAAGTPSIGLMQTIQPTFNAYALPGHGEITNPVDNIIAGTRYALARYGSLDNVPGIVALGKGQPYVGY